MLMGKINKYAFASVKMTNKTAYGTKGTIFFLLSMKVCLFILYAVINDIVKPSASKANCIIFSGSPEARAKEPLLKPIFADRDKISQVVVNLLSNALKYSPDGGTINITIEQEKDQVILKIRDTGIGIAAEDAPYIFERFYRADKSRNRETGGSGVGLTIVKAIIDAHGGRVTVDSRVGEGTEFTVMLPK